jgi:peroxiredoxin
MMVALGTPMPTFTLPDADGAIYTSSDLCGSRGTLVIFLCNHCPFVIHIGDELGRLGKTFPDRGISIVGINSNDAEHYPADAPQMMPSFAATHGITFPYLYDQSQQVARDFDAACTPDYFLYDNKGLLVYRGQLDGSRPGNDIPVTGDDLRGALDALCQDVPVTQQQHPSMGCNIKWIQTTKCMKGTA